MKPKDPFDMDVSSPRLPQHIRNRIVAGIVVLCALALGIMAGAVACSWINQWTTP